jgi:hypothetical protein
MFVLAVAAGLAGCGPTSRIENTMQLQQGWVRLEPHPSGAPHTYRAGMLRPKGSTFGASNYNRADAREAFLRTALDNCPAPRTTLEAVVPERQGLGGDSERAWFKVEC